MLFQVLELLLHLKEVLFLGLVLPVTEINIKKVHEQKDKTLEM